MHFRNLLFSVAGGLLVAMPFFTIRADEPEEEVVPAKILPAIQIRPAVTIRKAIKVAPKPLAPAAEAEVAESKQATDAQDPAAEESQSLEETHEQTATIKVGGDDAKPNSLHTFCLNKKGELLAGVGSGPGEIQFYSPEGEFLHSWKVPVAPEAINIGDEGELYVAGEGQVLKYDTEGKLLLQAEAPHAKAAKTDSKELREQITQQLKSRTAAYENTVKVYERQIALIEEKDEEDRTPADEARLTAFKRTMETMKKYIADHPPKEPTEEEITAQIKAMAASKMKASSISACGGDVFLATRAMVGYGFTVWRMDDKFENGKEIISELRGCCGQMDVQACKTGVYVAENSRHRVSRYDRDGEEIKHWGERARTGDKGFGSCCNPMNVCFGAGGEVYTAESNLGRIKCYSNTGELLNLVGSVKLVPGCKKVSIAVSETGKHVYMLDITRNHIIVMTKKQS